MSFHIYVQLFKGSSPCPLCRLLHSAMPTNAQAISNYDKHNFFPVQMYLVLVNAVWEHVFSIVSEAKG